MIGEVDKNYNLSVVSGEVQTNCQLFSSGVTMYAGLALYGCKR